MTVGDRIAKRRKELGMSQRTLAKAAGISQPTVSAIESSTKAPSTVTIQLIANVLRTTVAALMGEDVAPADAFAEELYLRPGMRVLFDAAKDAPDDVLQRTADLLEAMKNAQKNKP